MFRGFGSGIGMRPRTKVILWLVALGVVAMLVIFSHEPSVSGEPDTCRAKGIDPQEMKEGTCQYGKTTEVVVNVGDAVKLQTLEARLEGTRMGTTLTGPEGTKPASATKEFVTFDLAITNRTAQPQSVGQNQLVLLARRYYGEDVEVERGYEPRSLLGARPIAPGETVHGTVTFQVPPGETKQLSEKVGDIDIANFGPGSAEYEPEEVFDQPEIGVMRTYEIAGK
jgi:Domain of unknown function (DUF4352)